jgi:hypothetical protein
MTQSEIPSIRRFVQNPENLDGLRWEGIDLKNMTQTRKKAPTVLKILLDRCFLEKLKAYPVSYDILKWDAGDIPL